MKYHSHLNTALSLLKAYDGSIPFVAFSKNFFKEHKKYGSSDRKNILRCCYAYFRMGNALNDVPSDEKIFAGLYLTALQQDPVLTFFKPQELLNDAATTSIFDRIQQLKSVYPSLDILSIFKWKDELSDGIDVNAFVLSHLQQPDLFLRIRPGYHDQVIKRLNDLSAGTESAFPSQTSISPKILNNAEMAEQSPAWIMLPQGFPVEKHFNIDEEVVIQDLSSQKIGDLFSDIDEPVHTVWDCCAGSGGKSILAVDHFPAINLTVSDIRDSIILNLKKRFQAAKIDKYKIHVADLTKQTSVLPGNPQFDLVIADVPCSGSGTWSRTPEQLIHFKTKKIAQYAAMQIAIVNNVIPNIKPGGFLLYITCSVFSKENEQIVHQLLQNHPLHIIRQGLLKGYDQKADTLFVTLFKKL
jgi:16S rRNA (cytosine967-C5)-methyltransferase